jgi:hypothetical protein
VKMRVPHDGLILLRCCGITIIRSVESVVMAGVRILLTWICAQSSAKRKKSALGQPAQWIFKSLNFENYPQTIYGAIVEREAACHLVVF